MFTYINPRVREQLVRDGKLIQIDAAGQAVELDRPRSPGELVINILGPIPLPLHLDGKHYQCQWYATVRRTELRKVEELADELRNSGGENLFATLASSMAVNSVLLIGDAQNAEHPLVRVHSNCLTGDVFGSERCECGPQLSRAFERIAEHPGGGMIVYMAGHEGRGIGLWAKAATYLLQDAGENTYQANESLGLPADCRDFRDAAALILHFLGNRPMTVLTNNPRKMDDLREAGLDQVTFEKHVTGVNPHNRHYLAAKKTWGHHIVESDIAEKSGDN